MRYNKKSMEIYEKLGALQFQKIVFFVEKIKFSFIDKFIPNLLNYYDKNIDRQLTRKLKKCNDEQKRKQLILNATMQKAKLKRELYTKESRNYHLDYNHLTEFVKWLHFNKRIHVKGLIKNIIIFTSTIIIDIICPILSPWIINLILAINTLSAIKNFQCINLQNYNLCRFENERTKKLLQKAEERRKKEIAKKLEQGSKVIEKAFEKTNNIPSQKEVISQITTREQQLQLLYYAREQLKKFDNSQKQKCYHNMNNITKI